MKRTCGECTLCCTLLPVKGIAKPANTRCQHQSHARGCKVYRKDGFPIECGLWNCRWLTGDDTYGLGRPDRTGYVLDIMPDFIQISDNDTGAVEQVQVVQVWCDPKRRDAHKDPDLRAYLSRRADEGIAALIRYDARDGFVLVAPQFTGGRGWQEMTTGMCEKEHTVHEIVKALGPDYVAVDLREKMK